MRSVRDLAIVYNWLLHDLKLDLKLEGVAGVGLGFGGWIAAEMAMMSHHVFSRMVLVNAMGLQPRTGEIMDQFLIDSITYVRSGFADEHSYASLYTKEPSLDQLEQWEINREMTSRIAYKPYMFDQQMPQLIRGVSTPTLVVCGSKDQIVPQVCAEQYRDAIKGARLETIAGAGHYVEAEKPAELAKLIRDFATAH
jgi:pimeloyl-ACP methyl ester carboxylesterase